MMTSIPTLTSRANYMFQLTVLALLIQLSALGQAHAEGCGAKTGNPTPNTPGVCTTAQGTNSPATQGNTSSTQQGAGNPINVITGNKYQQEADMPALPGELGLEIVRHYNSSYHTLGMIGYGWRLSYETDLYVVNNTLQIAEADGSRIIFVRNPQDPCNCAALNPAYGKVTVQKTPRGDEYLWTWLNGRQLHFNTLGKLERISTPTGQIVTLQRGLRGELLKVTDPQDRSMTMEYAANTSPGFKGIIAINSPVGRFNYTHDNQPKSPGISNLLSVTYPHAEANSPSISRQYHYGETNYTTAPSNASAPNDPSNLSNLSNPKLITYRPHLLTGITLHWQTPDGQAQQTRTNTWAYDAQGRGILSVKGLPKQLDAKGNLIPNTGLEQVNLSYQDNDTAQPKATPKTRHTAKATLDQVTPEQAPPYQAPVHTTILTNSLGQTTTYTHTQIANEYRLLSVIGAGCVSCGEPNVKYRYDSAARLTQTTHLDATGNPTYAELTSYDPLGRITQQSRIDYLQGKAQPPKLQQRYEYPAALQDHTNNLPSLIAIPSVVSGKEHQIRLQYNAAGQPTAVTETGYSPATSALNTKTTQAIDPDAPTLISRSTHYSYSRIRGKSLLTQIDGPLPNGKTNTPQDSDITQYQYDKEGRYLTAVQYPAALTTHYTYDEEGSNPTRRIITVTGPDEQKIQLTYNTQGALDSIKKIGVEIHVEYDYQDRAVVYRRNDGAQIGISYLPSGSIRYTLPDGQTLVKSYDTERRLIAQNWQDAFGTNLTLASRVEYVAESGQPSRIIAPSGLETSFNYDKNGTLVSTQHGRQTDQKQFDPVSHLLTVKQNEANYTVQSALEQSKLTLTLSNGAQHSQITDDFGRVIFNQHPDKGISLAIYDQADHLVKLIRIGVKDTTAQRTTYAQYDLLGRLTEEHHANHTGKINTHDSIADEEIITYQYHGIRLTHIASPAQDTAYKYNAFGQLIQQIVSLKTFNAGEASTQTYPLNYSTSYVYDSFGRIQTVILPEQAKLTHHYNVIGQLASIDYQAPAHAWWVKAIRWVWENYGTEPIVANISTDSAHGLTAFTHNNGLKAKAQFDQVGRLVAWQDGNVDSQLTFNAEDKLASIQKHIPQLGDSQLTSHPASHLHTQQLTYNVYGQLTQVQVNPPLSLKDSIQAALNETYQLDLNGNRLGAQVGQLQDRPQQESTYQYPTHSDQLLSVTGTHHTQYAYNSLGEPTQILQQNELTKLNRAIYYGARGQILSINDNGKPIANYQYNHALQRTHKHTNTQDSYYLWHGGLIDAEIENTAGRAHLSKRYLYLGIKPVAVIEYDADNQASIYAIHTDYLGTPQAITNANQQVVWRAEYDAFGEVNKLQAAPLITANTAPSTQQGFGLINTANASTTPQSNFEFNLRLAGQYADAETGYHYNWHRYYDPQTGRYLTPDPIGLQGGFNAYTYTNHDPMGSLDPWGLFVSGFFERSTGHLFLYDDETGKSVSINDAFTGATMIDGALLDKPTQDIPLGEYEIFNWANKGWFRLDKVDKESRNDWDESNDRGFFRLHPGTNSNGCITVDKNSDSWLKVSGFIKSTKITSAVSVTSWKTIPFSSSIGFDGKYSAYTESLIKYGTLYVVQ